MANGDKISSRGSEFDGGTGTTTKLIDAATGTTSGSWVPNDFNGSGSVHTFGTFVGTVQVRGSNEEKPADNTDGIQIGSDITAPGLVAITVPCKWIKAKVSAFTSGTINVNHHGVAG